jgi:hypothetical protein
MFSLLYREIQNIPVDEMNNLILIIIVASVAAIVAMAISVLQHLFVLQRLLFIY